MKRRGFLRVLGVVGVSAIALTATAVAAVLPEKHPEFAKPGSMIRAQDFQDLAATVDALVEHVSR